MFEHQKRISLKTRLIGGIFNLMVFGFFIYVLKWSFRLAIFIFIPVTFLVGYIAYVIEKRIQDKNE